MSDDTPVGVVEIELLPRDASRALAMRERFTSNEEWMKDWKTNEAKQAMLGYLRFVSTPGNDPNRWGKTETVGDVRAQMTDRDREIDDKRVEIWGKFIDNFDDVKRATIARGLCTKQESEEARRELARMKRDGEFARRVLSGDTATVYSWRGLELSAGEIWARVNLVASMQVAPDDHKW